MAFGPGNNRSSNKRQIHAGSSVSVVSPRGALDTAVAGTNNDLKFTSVRPGSEGNSHRVRYVVAGNNTPLSVTRSGNDITVNVATDGAGAPTSTAAQVRDAINNSDEAKHLVKAENATGNNGTGVVAALAFTSLAGGAQPVNGNGGTGFSRVSARGTSKNG